jgi:hypothetical protein
MPLRSFRGRRERNDAFSSPIDATGLAVMLANISEKDRFLWSTPEPTGAIVGPPPPLKSGRPRANHLQLPLPRATAIGNRQDQDHRVCTRSSVQNCSPSQAIHRRRLSTPTGRARGFGPALPQCAKIANSSPAPAMPVQTNEIVSRRVSRLMGRSYTPDLTQTLQDRMWPASKRKDQPDRQCGIQGADHNQAQCEYPVATEHHDTPRGAA